MKEEYITQIGILDDDMRQGLLEDILITLDGKATIYTKGGLKAHSSSGDSLDLTPIHEISKTVGKPATWYMCRVTEYVDDIKKQSLKKLDLEQLGETLWTVLSSKHKEVTYCAIYHITATDVSHDYKIIR